MTMRKRRNFQRRVLTRSSAPKRCTGSTKNPRASNGGVSCGPAFARYSSGTTAIPAMPLRRRILMCCARAEPRRSGSRRHRSPRRPPTRFSAARARRRSVLLRAGARPRRAGAPHGLGGVHAEARRRAVSQDRGAPARDFRPVSIRWLCADGVSHHRSLCSDRLTQRTEPNGKLDRFSLSGNLSPFRRILRDKGRVTAETFSQAAFILGFSITGIIHAASFLRPSTSPDSPRP